MDKSLRSRLSAIAAEYLGDTPGCHRMDHTLRVVANARRLSHAYPEADAELVETAAWLHDIGRKYERQERISHAVISAREAEKLLPALGFSPERAQVILEAIADHRFSSGRVPASLEGRLLQDADRIDALGAIGIARTFAYAHERELYHPTDPFAETRTLDDGQFVLDHFYVKLLKLTETLHTTEARALATERTEFMQEFLRQIRCELDVAES